MRRTPYTVGSLIAGFKIPTSLTVEQFQDQWNNNPGGDGESLVIFSFQDDEKEKLTKACGNKHYNSLPIKDTLPDDFIYRYVKKETQLGFYQLSIDAKDDRTYQITVLDLQENHLVIYNVIY